MAVRTWDGNDVTTPYTWSTAGNWVEGVVPVSTDEVVIPSGSAKITGGLNQSAVTLAGFTIERGYDQNIGTSDAPLQVAISVRAVIETSGGQQWVDFGASNYDVEVLGTGGASTGQRAFNVIGSNLATISVLAGSVGIATPLADSATVATLRVLGGDVWAGDNVSLTTASSYGGSLLQQCASTTTNVYGGTVTTKGTGAITTANVYDGSMFPNSTGTITTFNAYGGSVDFTRSGLARTVTTLNATAQSQLELKLDPNVVTVSTFNDPTVPYETSYRTF